MATQKDYSALKVSLTAIVVSILGAFVFGRSLDLFTHNQLSCGTIGDIGGCDSGSIFVYLFGLYFGLLFSISLAHFGFIKWTKIYYPIIIIPLILLGFSDREFLKLVLGYTIAGILTGIIIRKFREQQGKP